MEATLGWLRRLFRNHYRTNPVFLPPRFTRREYGFMFLAQKGMHRHVAFRDRASLVSYLASRGPVHAYYSTAYYDRPDASQMADKGWKGADLIFDLDADHLPGAKGQSFETQLERVRSEALHVAEEFLLGHFGFGREDVRVAFSGGRGYHIHVTRPDIIPLDARARREIVSYVTGNGLQVDRLVRKRAVARREVAGRESFAEQIEVPPTDAPGWPGLVARGLERQLLAISSLDDEAAIAQLSTYRGVGDKRATEALQLLRDGASPRQVIAILPASFTKGAVEAAAASITGEADEPVTADVKRLIRLPGTLHGKTGLRVTPIALNDLAQFDPLVDAVALSDEEVEVELSAPASLSMMENQWDLPAGRHRLPTYAAALLCLRRQALYRGEPA